MLAKTTSNDNKTMKQEINNKKSKNEKNLGLLGKIQPEVVIRFHIRLGFRKGFNCMNWHDNK